MFALVGKRLKVQLTRGFYRFPKSIKRMRGFARPFFALSIALLLTSLSLSGTAHANDTFANAEALAPTGGSLTGTTTGTTGETGEPATFGAGTLNTQWYNWTAPATGLATFATCNTTGNTTTNFDTTLGVYTGTAVNALTAVATNDDQGAGCEETANPGSGWAAGLSFNATAGTTYHIQLDGYTSAVGNFTLNWGMPNIGGLVTAVTTPSATEGGATGAFTVALSAPPTGTVSVTVPTAPANCTLAPATLSFTFANWNVPQTVTVTAVNDTIVNGTRNCGVANLTSSGGGYTATKAIPAITVLDNDTSITISKISNGGVAAFPFTGTNGVPNQTLTTATAGTAVTGTTSLLTTAGTATTITETAVAGYATTAIACTGLGAGGTATPNLVAGSVTLDAAATIGGSAIICTFTNGKRPTLTLTKISNGGVGAFTFTGTNGWASQTITTATAGTGVAGATQTLTTAGAATTITETSVAGYAVTAISCTGLGVGGTATPNLSSGSVTLDAAAVGPAASIACTFTNTKLPTATITKVSNGGVGAFSFSGTNGFANQTLTTAVAGTGVSGATQILTAASTAMSITETIPSGYFLSSVSCTGLGSGGTATPNLTTGVVAFNASATAPGSAIACTYTNTKAAPSLLVVKTVSPAGPFDVGQTITYTYKVTNNGNVPMQNISINDTHNGTGVFSGAKSETLTTDLGTLGDSTDTAANDGVWSVLGVGDSITFTATYIVTQHDVDFLQ